MENAKILIWWIQDQKALFDCNENEGHSGQFVYLRDDREDKEYFGLCEVEVFVHKGERESGACGGRLPSFCCRSLGDSHRSRVNNGEGERSGRQSAEEANKLFSCAAAKNNDGFYKVPSFLLLLLRAVREITKQSGERADI